MAFNKNFSGNNNYKKDNRDNRSGFNNTNKGGFNKNNFNNGGYVGAPYNFVPFNKTVIEVSSDAMPVHNVITDDLLTGEINYTITAKTDIMVDDGTGHFHKNARNQYSIPGSTMRGLIRNNVQILGLAGFDEDIDDYRLMYRNVANGAEKKFYNEVLGSKQVSVSKGSKPVGVLTNVKGGYIVKKGSKYFIYKTTVDTLSPQLNAMNYYVVTERNIAKKREDFPFFKENPKATQHNLNKGFQRNENKGRIQYRGDKNLDYKPDYYKVSYEVTNIKNVSKLGKPGQFSKEGYLVATGPMNDKKALYVIPELDLNKTPIEIAKADIDSFKIDFENKKNTLKRFKNMNYFNLPQKEGEYKPVFYVELNGKLYFGFTPRIRLFYEHNIKEGFLQQQKEFDYAKSIFGCIDGSKTGYKSKVSFSDAVIQGNGEIGDTKKLILAGPKPTSYLDYIKQSDQTMTYNQEDFELRGIKQYWLHNEMPKVEQTDKEKAASTISPLKAGAIFEGKVRFQNLTREELGLLVWSIKLNDNSWMNVGKAKAYGYGVIAFSDIRVKVVDNKLAYSFDTDFEIDPMKAVDIAEYINGYKEEINKKLGNKKIDELPSIKDFFAMKDSTCIPNNEDIRYMSIENREYQSRKKPLKSVQNTIKLGL